MNRARVLAFPTAAGFPTTGSSLNWFDQMQKSHSCTAAAGDMLLWEAGGATGIPLLTRRSILKLHLRERWEECFLVVVCAEQEVLEGRSCVA